MSDLILWRHAEAQDNFETNDLSRRLTAKGNKQASRTAEFLRKYLSEYRLFVSEAARSIETASCLDKEFERSEILNPNSSAKEILDFLGWKNSEKPIILVGHQPYLGEIISLELNDDSFWGLKKSAIAWLHSRSKHVDEVRLKLLLPCEFIPN